MAPSGTPRAVIVRRNTEINRTLNLRDVMQRFAADGGEAGGGSPEEPAARIREDAGELRTRHRADQDEDRPVTRGGADPQRTSGRRESCIGRRNVPRAESLAMKIIGWIVLIIFLIGLLVVLGLGKAIF